MCGCYHCLSTFKGLEITLYIDRGRTAMCPVCNIDSVLPEVTDTKDLKDAHIRWFCPVQQEAAFEMCE